ncbi:MAG TPA: PLP-dependent aminotransferase family protein [Candidatus Limnocylindrales bacterium]|nr:PLP-dependent aminotransferase family protein [Candidatus Limnocylindrales bacterium]
MPIDVQVSLVGRRSLTQEIYRQLRAAILDGRLQAGDRLPATRDLAQRLAVARTTIMAVYDRLLSEGFTESHVGRGTFVAGELRPRPRTSTPSGVLAARAIWESIPEPAALRRTFEFDFRTGVPDVRSFPFDSWRRLNAREWHRAAIGRGSYGEPGGDPDLREAIAEHVAVSRGVRATRGNVIVTSGTQQALDVVARVLLSHGDLVAVEDPGYGPPRHLFRSHGLNVVGIPVDDAGIRVDAIPEAARVVLVSPSHQYPLGMAMSLGRRLALLSWAEDHDAAIIEDDYDSEFRLSGRPVEPLQMLDDAGRVIYVGTFSKTMLPTLRLGFAIVPESIRRAMEAAKFVADWHSPIATQRALAAFIRNGDFARHVRRMRVIYRDRHNRISAILSRDFADELRVVRATAGVHLAALSRRRSVSGIDGVNSRAATAGVGLQAIASMAVDNEPTAGLLFGYGGIATEHIEEGLTRLRAAFEEVDSR